MVEKLSVQIDLEGGAELKQQFDAATASIAKLGNTAEEAFAEATAAAQKFGASTQDFQKVEGVIRTLAARARDSSTPFAELAANYDRARQSAASFVPVAAQVEQATKKLGESSSSTRIEIAALARGLSAVGIAGGPVVSALANIGTRFGALALAAAAIGGTTTALIKFANAAEETEKSLSQLQVASGRSFENLSALAQVFAEGGTSTKQFASEFGNLSEKIAAAAQDNHIRAASKDAVEWANDIDRVRHQFDNLAQGVTTTFDPLTKLDTKVKAVLESVARVKPDEQIFRLADIFKTLATDMERAQLGKALGLSPESIARLNLGGDALRAMAEEAKQVGLILNDVDKNNLRGMRAAQVEAIGLFDQLKQKMGALVAPELTSFWDGFRNQIAALAPTFMELAESAKRGLQSLSTDLGFIYGQILKIVEGWGLMAAAFASSDVKASMDPFVEKLRQAIDGLNALVAIAATWVGQKVFNITAEQAAELQRQIMGVTEATAKLTQKTREQAAAAADVNAIQSAATQTQPTQTLAQGLTNTATAASQATAGVNDYIAIVNKAIEAQRKATEAVDKHIDALRRQRVAMFEQMGMRDVMTRQLDIAAYDPANFASGGFVGGTGTGTSDSNLAWVSRGEHIMPARAVAQPGVLALLESLRRSGGNLSRVLDGMGRFALGGMVPRTMPAFASGGLAGGMSNVTIQFPGLPTISGLRASSDVVDQLHKAAALAQVRSGGRKPSRYS